MPAYLAVVAGLPPRVFVLETGTWIAGRASGVSLELNHLEISRQHCRFAWDGSTCTVEDLESARGTRVNGEPIRALTILAAGDKVGIGPAVVEFGLGEPPALAPPDAAASGDEAPRMLVFGQPGERVAVTRELTLGREPGGDVWLNDPGVSRRHASIRPLPHGGCAVTDLHSTAGSFVNGHRFDTHELTVGDRLQIGPFCFQFDGQALNRVGNTSGGTLRTEGVCVRTPTFTILDHVGVHIPASRFVGIIGPSGAGKSSLLRVISGMGAPTEGVVFVDGADLYAGRALQSFGFVPQEDIVHPELTVTQALHYSARLRLPAATPPHELQKLILQTMEQLGLREHSAKGITKLSGGQRKRVSVGAELLAKPSILFLDEPSSGLDPATEFKLMELLRDLADTGCTIVCTTHVMENAYLMDQLIVLVGGCLAFQGSAAEARSYFAVGKLSALYDQLLERPAKHWQSAFQARADASAPALCAPPPHDATPRRRAFALPILLARQWAILRSDWRNFLILLGQPLIIAALVSWVVSEDRGLVMFFAYLATLWFGTSNAAQEIVKELAIYKRERLVGVGAHSYLLSKFLFLTTVTALQVLLLFGTVLLLDGGRDGSVPWQLAGLLGTAVAGVGLGSTISALARSVMQAVMIVPLLLIPMIVFSGHPVTPGAMSKSVLFVSRLTPTFSAQTIMDTSFLWQQPMNGDVISDHGQSLRNLDPDRELSTGDTFTNSAPARRALLTHAAWALLTYLLAWTALKMRERE